MLDLLEIRQEARSSKVESTKVQQETQKMTAVKQAGYCLSFLGQYCT